MYTVYNMYYIIYIHVCFEEISPYSGPPGDYSIVFCCGAVLKNSPRFTLYTQDED